MSHSVSPSDHKDHPALHAHGAWETVFQGEPRAALEQLLPGYIAPRRWFGSKARTIETAQLIEIIPITQLSYLTLVKISFTAGEPETYVLPLAFVAGEQAEVLRRERPMAVIAVLRTPEAEGVLYDAVWNPRFDAILLEMIGEGKQFTGSNGDVVASATSVFARLRGDASQALHAARARRRAEQHEHALRRAPAPQAVPAAGSGRQPRPGDRPVPDRARCLRAYPARCRGDRIPPSPGPGVGRADHAGDPAGFRAQPGRRLVLHAGRSARVFHSYAVIGVCPDGRRPT